MDSYTRLTDDAAASLQTSSQAVRAAALTWAQRAKNDACAVDTSWAQLHNKDDVSTAS